MCGRCCHWRNAQGKLIKCKHLVKLGNGKTLCRIYHKRLGSRIGTINFEDKRVNVYCIEREKSPLDYKDCPFNTGKPMFDGD